MNWARRCFSSGCLRGPRRSSRSRTRAWRSRPARVAYAEGGEGWWPQSSLFATEEELACRRGAAARRQKGAPRSRRSPSGGGAPRRAAPSIGGMGFPTDEASQAKLTAAVVASVLDNEYAVRWKLVRRLLRVLDHATLIAAAQGVRAHVQAASIARRRSSQDIDAAADIDALRGDRHRERLAGRADALIHPFSLGLFHAPRLAAARASSCLLRGERKSHVGSRTRRGETIARLLPRRAPPRRSSPAFIPISCASCARAAALCEQKFVVFEGVRSLARERSLIARGKSALKNPFRCRHVPTTGRASMGSSRHAVDLVPHRRGRPQWPWPQIYPIARAMKAAALAEHVTVEWGGDWRTFKDGPHFQLPCRSIRDLRDRGRRRARPRRAGRPPGETARMKTMGLSYSAAWKWLSARMAEPSTWAGNRRRRRDRCIRSRRALLGDSLIAPRRGDRRRSRRRGAGTARLTQRAAARARRRRPRVHARSDRRSA